MESDVLKGIELLKRGKEEVRRWKIIFHRVGRLLMALVSTACVLGTPG
jgi:hypothetical protein